MILQLPQRRHLSLSVVLLTLIFTASYLALAVYWKIGRTANNSSNFSAHLLPLPRLPFATPDTACDSIDISWIVNDRQYWDGWNPKALFLHPNESFSTGNVLVSEGSSVCIVVLLSPIPTTSLVKSQGHQGSADSVVLSAIGNQVEKTIDLLQHPRHSVAYYASTYFAHADTYLLKGRIEHRSYFWESPIYHAYRPMIFESQNALIVLKMDTETKRLPICDPRNYDHLFGSWVEKSQQVETNPFDFYNMFNSAQEDHTESGRLFVADKCRMQYFSLGQIAQCLNKKVVHVWSDNNVARNLKALSSAGQWCPSKNAPGISSSCRCSAREDSPKQYPWLTNSRSALTLKKSWNVDANIYHNFVDSIVLTDYKQLMKQQTAIVPRADVVILGVGNGDIAQNMVSPSQFAESIKDLLSHMAQVVYPQQTILVRTTQYFCCLSVPSTSWNHGRSNAFSHAIRIAVEKLHNPRVLLWDVHKLGIPGNVCLSQDSVNTRRSVVNIENILLGNAICRNSTRPILSANS